MLAVSPCVTGVVALLLWFLSPLPGAGYGIGHWVERKDAQGHSTLVSSPGAFGFTPWLDRNVGYYAVIAMESGNTDTGVVPASVRLAQDLKPLIAQALR